MSDKILVRVKKVDVDDPNIQDMIDKYAGRVLVSYRSRDILDQPIFVSDRVKDDRAILTDYHDRHFYKEEVEIIELIDDKFFEMGV